MARTALPIGTEKPTPQGYIRVRVAYNLSDTGWILKHHLIAAEKLGRPVDKENERVVFVDGDRKNYDPDNIKVVEKSPQAKRTKAERKADMEAELERLELRCSVLRRKIADLDGQ